VATGVVARFVLARFSMPEHFAIFIALPFVVISGVAAWQQLRRPSAEQVAATLASLRELSWHEFSSALEEGFRREGYSVARLNLGGADLELTRSGRVSLVGGKRWKVARAGIEPLRELEAARQSRDAHECIYVAAGDITENARAFAAEKKIRLRRRAGRDASAPRPLRSFTRKKRVAPRG
jgi:restriction system protein